MIFDKTNIQCDGNRIKVIVSPAAGFDGARREIDQFKTEVNQRVDEVEDLVVGIGSGEGGKAYPSIADALAAITEDNVMFTIPKGEPDAGVWATDSSAPNGYVFVNDLFNSEKVNELVYRILPELEFGGVAWNTGNLVENVIRARTRLVQIDHEETYEYSFNSNFGLVEANIVFYDVNNEYIQGSESVPSITSPPEGAFYLRLSYQKSNNSEITQEELDDAEVSLSILNNIGYQKIINDVQKLKEEASFNDSKWAGGKLVVLGDSISYGFIPRNAPGYPGRLNSYAKLTAEKLGMTFQNKGISGTTLGAKEVGDTSRNPFVYRYEDLDDDADVVLVMGGTNDIRNWDNLGTAQDRTEDTYYGALHVLCLGLLEKYRHNQGTDVGKDKHIVLCTPIKLLGDDISGYVEAVKTVGNFYSLPVWDANNLSGINPEILRTVQGYDDGYTDMYNPYITDGTHPTQEGHVMMANSLVGFLNTLK